MCDQKARLRDGSAGVAPVHVPFNSLNLPRACWPRHGIYAPGPGPEIRDQTTQLAQLVALGRTVAVVPDSARAWLWSEHAAVPLTDAPPVVTHIARPAHSRSPALASLVRTAVQLAFSR